MRSRLRQAGTAGRAACRSPAEATGCPSRSLALTRTGVQLDRGRRGRRALRTAYGITSQRAVIADPRSFSDMPLRRQPVTVRRTRDGRHASVVFGTTAGPGRGSAFRNLTTWHYANTGMEPLARGVGCRSLSTMSPTRTQCWLPLTGPARSQRRSQPPTSPRPRPLPLSPAMDSARPRSETLAHRTHPRRGIRVRQLGSFCWREGLAFPRYQGVRADRDLDGRPGSGWQRRHR
jgi:hypothetical protein